MNEQVPMISVVAACSGMGKTTLLLALARYWRKQGLRLAVIKHGHHLDLPPERKDGSLYGALGAPALTVTPQGCLLTTSGQEPSLAQAASWLAPWSPQLILVEGYKRGRQPKIEVCRRALCSAPSLPPAQLWAVVADFPPPPAYERVPWFPWGQVEPVAECIAARLSLTVGQERE